MAGWKQSEVFFSSWDCSNCRESVYIEDQGFGDQYNLTPFDMGWKYCPYCGAHMTIQESAKFIFGKGFASSSPVLVYEGGYMDDDPPW